jgi:hypothetical protein
MRRWKIKLLEPAGWQVRGLGLMARCNTPGCTEDNGIVEGYCGECDLISTVVVRCRDAEFRRKLFRALPLSYRRLWFRKRP